ncbi:MAG: hypothetical protein KF830_11405 [Planctomycetes bacterium]|nr:hypothetical protein [Planctomycetota bacterium]
MVRYSLIGGAFFALASLAAAQGPPQSGLPMTPPPVPHPGLASQPLFDDGTTRKPDDGARPPAVPEAAPPPEAVGPKLAGRPLQWAVAKVLELPWLESLAEARARAAATGRPILWLQALGDLDGHASSTLQSLRGLVLADPGVHELLATRFVLGWRNIERERHVGLSQGYTAEQTAVGSTNGAGGRNVQVVLLASDATVLLVLPGFWHAADLVPELRLGLDLHALHRAEGREPAEKVAMLAALHRAHMLRHGDAARRRGTWQAADRDAELVRSTREPRDSVVVEADGRRRLVPLPDLVHARVQLQPWKPLGEFDFEALVDYGQPLHDENAKLEPGRPFPRAEQANQQRERAKERAAREAGKAAEKEKAARPRAKPAEGASGGG